MDDHAGSSRGALGSCSLEDEDPSTLQETSRDSGDEVTDALSRTLSATPSDSTPASSPATRKSRKTPGRRKAVGVRKKGKRRVPAAVKSGNDTLESVETVGNSDSTNYCGSGPTSDDERSFSCSSEVSDVIEFLDAVSEEIISSSLSSASEVNTLDIVSDDVGTASDKEPSDVPQVPFFRSRKKRLRQKVEKRRKQLFRASRHKPITVLRAIRLKPVRRRNTKQREQRKKIEAALAMISDSSNSSWDSSGESPPMSLPSFEGPYPQGPSPPAYDPSMSPPHKRLNDSQLGQLIFNQEIIEAVQSIEGWLVTGDENSVKIVSITNASLNIRAAIVYTTRSNSFNIFVHSFPLPSDHHIWKLLSDLESQSAASIGSVLRKLAHHIQNHEICCGDIDDSHSEVWKRSFAGQIDVNQEPICYRSKKCKLLVLFPGICIYCKFLGQRCEKAKKRLVNNQLKDISKINNRFMTTEQLSEKTKRLNQILKLERQKYKRLQLKFAKMIKTEELTVPKETSDDLLILMQEVLPQMSELQKLFWEEQLKALKVQNNPRSMRWHPMMVKIALHLQMISPSGSRYLQDIGCLRLPSKRRLYDYSHFVEPKEGCQEEIITDIKKKIKQKTDASSKAVYFNLLFDEIHIRGKLVYNKNGELIGFVKLTEVEAALTEYESSIAGKQKEPQMAKKVLAYMLTQTGVQSDIHEIVALYSTGDLTASQLYTRTWEVIHFLEGADIPILALIFDGASVNRRFLHMHLCIDRESKFVYVTRNAASNCSRPLYFILDPPHLLKTIRNCFANSYAHSRTRKLWKGGEPISWEIIEKLFEVSAGQKFRGHKLTASHVKLTPFSKMTVYLAAQAVSGSVETSLETYKDHDDFKDLHVNEAIKFIGLVNKFWDTVNSRLRKEGKMMGNEDKEPFYSKEDPRLLFLSSEFLDYFNKWEDDVLNRPGNFTVAERNQMKIGHQTMEAIQITVRSTIAITCFLLEKGAPFVETRSLNQDPLEQEFSTMRKAQGSDDNMDLLTALNTRVNLHAQQQAALPRQRGNTEVQKRKLEVDDTPLLVRKRKRTT